MKRKSTSAIAAVLALSFSLVAFSSEKTSSSQTSSAVAANATNAAYRDGMYEGGLRAKSGKSPVAATSRWSNAQDRDAFSAGYAQAYNEVLGNIR